MTHEGETLRYSRAIRIATVATTVSAAAFGAACFASSANVAANVIAGTVRNAQGQAVADAHVQLNAFAADKTGVHEIMIGSATSDAAGHYSFAAPSASQTASIAKADGGTINYEVDVTSTAGGVWQTATTTAPAKAVLSADSQTRAAAMLPSSGESTSPCSRCV